MLHRFLNALLMENDSQNCPGNCMGGRAPGIILRELFRISMFGCILAALWLPFGSPCLPFALFNYPSAPFSCIFHYISKLLFVFLAFRLKFDLRPYFFTHLNSIRASALLRTLLRSISPTLSPTYLARCGICRRHLD